eukprot:CAMPEP_0178390996 /NCGR_PEP_ID=MMETSP0689_2-20121128/10935_1 /TAXON_ID=160604 /ORGANISM="Amphidinium massartii, Strain CS-259" /LENGTH=135 /DNA_ID=CAMNT_0020011525 /DNA_START=299 /DNA_END=706 /DNA_ORIENTATION=+
MEHIPGVLRLAAATLLLEGPHLIFNGDEDAFLAVVAIQIWHATFATATRTSDKDIRAPLGATEPTSQLFFWLNVLLFWFHVLRPPCAFRTLEASTHCDPIALHLEECPYIMIQLVDDGEDQAWIDAQTMHKDASK